ncbi:MAG: tRNA pseudouridine(55) synthase TruB [Planctomycetota bacterium]
MLGLLNMAKPAGITSRDVVNRIQRLVRPAKIGHAGTLDPLATGVLVVAIGSATRLIEQVQAGPKSYRATFLLGRSSDSDDTEGEVTVHAAAPVPTAEQLALQAAKFLGVIQQVPPVYSAVRVGGRRAYDRARRGEQITLTARPVTIHRLAIITYDYPQLILEINCSSGTYIRSIGRDLAVALNTTAIMSALERTAVSRFRIEDATQLEALQTREDVERHQVPLLWAVEDWPRVTVTAQELIEIRHGRTIICPTTLDPSNAAHVAAVDERGELVALLTARPHSTLGPTLNLV